MTQDLPALQGGGQGHQFRGQHLERRIRAVAPFSGPADESGAEPDAAVSIKVDRMAGDHHAGVRRQLKSLRRAQNLTAKVQVDGHSAKENFLSAYERYLNRGPVSPEGRGPRWIVGRHRIALPQLPTRKQAMLG
ncbi:hypothetical protein [Ruegeria sp. MALMAid1280]|uniref:hypothetical protein n=1 Tax=Ruegeria sp. MALMAid1280 TaxID=3411634 RepID=UPI003BA2FDCB